MVDGWWSRSHVVGRGVSIAVNVERVPLGVVVLLPALRQRVVDVVLRRRRRIGGLAHTVVVQVQKLWNDLRVPPKKKSPKTPG